MSGCRIDDRARERLDLASEPIVQTPFTLEVLKAALVAAEVLGADEAGTSPVPDS
jgi:hypothetical protein